MMERGREQPPGFAPLAVSRPARRVAHAPVSVSQTAAETVVICAPFASALHVGTRRESRTERIALSTPILQPYSLDCTGHHMISVELCSASSRLSLRSPLAGLRP